MNPHVQFCRCLAALLVAALLLSLAEAGVRISLDKVPEQAVKTIKDKFPKATIRYVDKEGPGVFEFAMKEGDRKFDVGVNDKGKLLNVKEEIPADKLPDAVKKAVAKSFPGGEIIEIEKVISGEGDAAKVTFEIVVKTDKGKKGVEFDEKGKLIGDTD